MPEIIEPSSNAIKTVSINGQRWTLDGLETLHGQEQASGVWLGGLKSEALRGIRSRHGALLLKLLGNPTIEERDTWKSQQAWAESYIANQDAPSAQKLARLLTASEREAFGDTAAEFMAEKIIEKVEQTDTLISIAAGIRREAEKAVEASLTPEDVSEALVNAQAMADGAIAQVLTAQSA